MKIIQISKCAIAKQYSNNIDNEIHIFTQFFIHENNDRNEEIKECLKKNIKNINISKIHLLNEKLYSYEEMGISNKNKIIQTNIEKRLKFSNVFEYIRKNSIKGYIVFVNCDIFFDSTLQNLKYSEINEKKKMFALLRYEYNGYDTNTSCIYGPRFDSQDTWIFHSNNIIKECHEKAFNFQFGKPGCDNKIIYLMKILGYEIINDPNFIRTFHNHKSKIRDYTKKDVINIPWGVIIPYGTIPHSIPPSLGINLNEIYKRKQNIWFEDNDILRKYIQLKLNDNLPFLIPRVSGIENNIAVFHKIRNSYNNEDINNYIKNVIPIMKNNTGIKLSCNESIKKYSDLYLDAFDNCDIYCGWEIQGNYLNHISESHEYIKQFYVSKQMIWSFSLDIYHYIYSNPWTYALKGKKILIVSPFKDSILEQIPKRQHLYDGVDLFPECTFIVIKPPVTQGSEKSLEFDEELEIFYTKIDNIKDNYDVALLSCGGYCNIISNYIFKKHNKSAIYVGGVLQMFFGIYGNRWIKERPDILRLYMNRYWIRPKIHERPKGYENIESSCYW